MYLQLEVMRAVSDRRARSSCILLEKKRSSVRLRKLNNPQSQRKKLITVLSTSLLILVG